MDRLKFSILCIAMMIASHGQAQTAAKILVAAASDLKFALDSVATLFKKSHPGTVDITYGSSGKLFAQISNSAPFDIFFSADITYPQQLKEKQLTLSEIYIYGKGRIVLWSKKIDPKKDGMNTLLSPTISKIAIANPQHAPYGKRAEEALAYYKLTARVKPKLVYGENISQTAQFVTSGAADAGIVALSLAVSPNMKKENGAYFIIPEESHKPLEQGAVITKHAQGNDYATAFLDYMKSDAADAILRHFGFTKP
jgi:molybdate transport system substrate-binding protein